MKIVLLGYMASGKTYTAKKLSKHTLLKNIDLDTYIEEKEGISVAAIFKQKGEISFRLLENASLKELLQSKDSFILSVGGGTPCYANNMSLIQKYSNSVYLNVNIITIYNRLIKEKERRPLVKDISNDNLKEFIAKHLFERSTYYSKANIQIIIKDKAIEEIIEEIVLKLKL